MRRYTDQVGHLWCSLADYYIRAGLFERARDIYEESIQTVTTVRDFTQVFDAYAQFEELALSKRMEQMQKDPGEEAKTLKAKPPKLVLSKIEKTQQNLLCSHLNREKTESNFSVQSSHENALHKSSPKRAPS